MITIWIPGLVMVVGFFYVLGRFLTWWEDRGK